MYLAAVVLFGVKFWSSLRGMEMQSAGTLWTTPEGWRIYVMSKVTPTLAGLSVLAATALLHAPAAVMYLLTGWVFVIITITVAALLTHRPRIAAARQTATGASVPKDRRRT